MKTIIKPEEMRNVKLSEGTKEYIVAYKMATESTDIVYKQVVEIWGEDASQEMIKPLFDVLGVLQKEILNLMMHHINVNLGVINCTEI